MILENVKEMVRVQLTSWLRRLRVQHKIALGYGLSLGIAIAGTTLGIMLADQQQQQAELKVRDAAEEFELITHLQADLLLTLVEHNHVKSLLSDPVRMQEHYGDFHKHYESFQQSWKEFKLTEGGTKGQTEIEADGEVIALNAFLEKYRGIPETYIQILSQLPAQFDSTYPSPEEIALLRQKLTQLEDSRLLERMDNFAQDLTVLSTTVTQKDYAEAAEDIQRSYRLRWWVIGISMASSIAMATVLSIFTSRAIASPLQALSEVAQQAIRESNFDLKTTVETEDEVGRLAVSFNHLIASVKELLDEQQEYNKNLEFKISERTRELSHKNIQLKELLEKLRSTQVQMVQSEKMSSLGQLVAGVAHEINNPVNFIYGNLVHIKEYVHNLLSLIHLYQKTYPSPIVEIEKEIEDIDLFFLQEDLPSLVNSMQVGTDRIREIVAALRNFSRLDEAEAKVIDIHEGIDSTLLILRHRLKAKAEDPGIQVICDYGNLPPIECYPGKLNQVFMNILANAIDALEVQNKKHQYDSSRPKQIEIRTSVIDSHWVEIAIADNGTGIPEAIKTQIFNPFFTTKPVGKGTGMGLAISYQIITEKHGGRLECFSDPELGTKFLIQIPKVLR